MVIETVSGFKVTCKSAHNIGEITGPKTTVIQFLFDECEINAVKCTTPGQPAGNILTPLLPDRLIIIKKEAEALKNKIGDDIGSPAGGPFAEFECGRVRVVITGSVIRPVKTNSMVKTETAKFTQVKGHQKPEKGEGEPPDVLSSSINGGAPLQTGLSLTEIQENEEKIEVNTIV